MDIGTAKPSRRRARRRAAPPDRHPRPDRRPIRRRSSRRCTGGWPAEIRARGRLPLLVGGTMLYFKALQRGPGRHAAGRRRRARRARRPRRARRLAGAACRAGARGPRHRGAAAPNDAQRIQRALEVWQLSGRPLSSLAPRGRSPARGSTCRCWRWSRRPRAGCTSASPSASTPCWRPASSTRCAPARPRRPAAELPSMRCVGYRQAWEALDWTGRNAPSPPHASWPRQLTCCGRRRRRLASPPRANQLSPSAAA
jgi:tRNA dimethylallyltransferase